MDMSRTSEVGRGRLSTLFWLAIFVAAGYAFFNVGPVYRDNYVLQDKLEGVARTPRGQRMEAAVSEGIREAIRESNLGDYLEEHDFRIATGEVTRTITVQYDREANILPGMPHMFHMVAKAEARVF
jgi:hypothetical protein